LPSAQIETSIEVLKKIPLTVNFDEMWLFIGNKKINTGYGLLLTLKREKLPGYISVDGIRMAQKNLLFLYCESRC